MELQLVLPEHRCGLFLEHNVYRNYHLTASEWIRENTSFGWRSEQARKRADETGEIWTLQWYPFTPVTSYAIAAPTLDELLAFASVEATKV